MSAEKERAREPIGESLGKEIRRRRIAFGYTIEELAERSGLAGNYLGTIENGKRDPSLSTVLAIAHGLGISLHELMGDSMRDVTPAAMEIAKLFDRAPQDVREGVRLVLQHHARRSSRG